MNTAVGVCSECRKIGMEIQFKRLQTVKRHVFVRGVIRIIHDFPINSVQGLSIKWMNWSSGGYIIMYTFTDLPWIRGQNAI